MTHITKLSIVMLSVVTLKRTLQASLVLYHPLKLKKQHIDNTHWWSPQSKCHKA
jgi:hypothetical protein